MTQPDDYPPLGTHRGTEEHGAPPNPHQVSTDAATVEPASVQAPGSTKPADSGEVADHVVTADKRVVWETLVSAPRVRDRESTASGQHHSGATRLVGRLTVPQAGVLLIALIVVAARVAAAVRGASRRR